MSTQFINPENPYVFDANFFSNQSHFNYEGSGFAVLHRLMNTLFPFLGILTACLVAYLVVCQTPANIRAFSRMIFLCSMFDIIYAFCDLWCQVISFWRGFGKK
jgi:hypothetical protein